MSAAAAVAHAPVVVVDLRKEIEVPKKNFVQLPADLLRLVREKGHDEGEKGLLLYIIEVSYGGEKRDGKWIKPEWVLLTREIAAGVLNQTPEGAWKCVDRAAAHGFIEIGKGEQKTKGGTQTCTFARLREDGLRSAPIADRRTLAKTSDAGENEKIQQWSGEPVLLKARQWTPPLMVKEGTTPIRLWSDSQISAVPSFNASGTIDLKLISTDLRLSFRGGTPVQPLDQAEAEMREFMNRWCRGRLGPVPDEWVKKAVEAKGEATDRDIALKFQARLPKIRELTSWKLIIDMIEEVARAAGKAGPKIPERSLENTEPPFLEEDEGSGSHWMKIRLALKASVSVEAYENWFRRTRFDRIAGTELRVLVPDEVSRDWIIAEYIDLIENQLAPLKIPAKRVVFEIAARSIRS